MAALGTKDLSLDQANAALHASINKAEEIGTSMDIAVVDAGGNLKAFARMGASTSRRRRPERLDCST